MVLTAEPLESRDVPAGPLLDPHSLPGAPWQIVIDPWGDAGEPTAGTVWQIFGTITTPAYDTDGNPGAFSPAELEQLAAIHEQVSDDFRPFNVDVTLGPPTVPPGRYQRVKVGGRGEWYSPTPTVSGVTASRFGQLSLFAGKDSPLYVFSGLLGAPANVAGVISHELGHSLGLSHDGTKSTEYYPGSGGWAPIMGAPFKTLTQWSAGTYSGATNPQDDLAVIAATLGLRPDDVGDSFATAAAMLSGQTKTGVVGTRADVDAFKFTSSAGSVTVSLASVQNGNLYAQMSLYDEAGRLLARGVGTAATLTASVPGGTYYVAIDGVAGLAPDDYGSLGQYRLTATAAPEGIPLPPPPAGVTLSVADIERPEGSSLQPFSFVLRLSRWLPYPVTVAYWTEDGMAVAGLDYRPVAGTLTIKPHLSSATVTVLVIGDRTPEPDKWFRFRYAVLDGDVAATSDVAVGTILNDDGELYLPPETQKRTT